MNDTTTYKDLQVVREVYTIHEVLGIPSKGISNTPPETCKVSPGKMVNRCRGHPGEMTGVGGEKMTGVGCREIAGTRGIETSGERKIAECRVES